MSHLYYVVCELLVILTWSDHSRKILQRYWN